MSSLTELMRANLRERHCPGCKTLLTSFSMTALSMPVEQYAMPRLRDMNKDVGWSVRSFVDSSPYDLQFLAFNSTCPQCTLISTWDFSQDELTALFNFGTDAPYSIFWAYSKEQLHYLVSKSPERMRTGFLKLYEILHGPFPPEQTDERA